MVAAEHFRKLENMHRANPINAYFEAEIAIEEGAARLVQPIGPKLHHAADAAHGAVYFKALDEATYFAAQSLVHDAFLVTASFNLYFFRPIAEGLMTAEAWVARRGQGQIVAEGVVIGPDGKEAARGTGAFMRSGRRLADVSRYRL